MRGLGRGSRSRLGQDKGWIGAHHVLTCPRALCPLPHPLLYSLPCPTPCSMPLMPLMPFNAHCSEPVLDTAAGVLRLRAPGMTELVVPLEPTPEQLRHPVKAKVWRKKAVSQ